MLDGGIACCALPYACARLRLSVGTETLGQSEVDEHDVSVLAPHDIERLEVEVQHVLGVHTLERLANLYSYVERLTTRELAVREDMLVKVAAREIFHDIIDRVVLLNGLEHLDDVVVVKPRQVLRLAQEVAAIVGAKRTVTHGEHTQSVSATHIAQEKLFYRHHGRRLDGAEPALQSNVGNIGYAERPLSENTLYAVVVMCAVDHGSGL